MIATLTGVSRADGVETTYKRRKKKGHAVGDYLSWTPNGHHNCNALSLKLILRPLSDMTEEEMIEVDVDVPNILSEYEKLRPTAFSFLLSKGFDLFGLIDAGLAIDKTKLKRTP